MTKPSDYSYLWDGSQSGWVLLRVNHQTLAVVVTFSAGGPTLREVAAMRATVPAFAAMPPSDAFASLKGRSRVSLGDFESKEGRNLATRCKQNGLVVEVAATDKSSYLPFNEQSNQCLIIEDNFLAEQICQQAISQGIRVKHVEA